MDYSLPLFFRSYDSVTPLVILHGLLGDSSNFRSTAEILGRKRPVIVPDLRNHGNSPKSPLFDYSYITEDIRRLVDEQQITRLHILGHSMGGKAAMVFADTYPDLVDKLIIVDIAPKRYPDYHVEVLDAMISMDLDSCKRIDDVVDALSKKIPFPPVCNFLVKNLSSSPGGGFTWKPDLDSLRQNKDHINPALQLKRRFNRPVLFIKGELSNFIQQQDYATIKKLYPRVEFSEIKRAGHWVHIDARDEFIVAVSNFL